MRERLETNFGPLSFSPTRNLFLKLGSHQELARFEAAWGGAASSFSEPRSDPQTQPSCENRVIEVQTLVFCPPSHLSPPSTSVVRRQTKNLLFTTAL